MANKYPSTFNERRRDITLIHVGWQQLAKHDKSLDDDAYRAMLWSVARVKSSTALDYAGRKKVLDHLKACGFKPVSKDTGKPANVKADLAPLMGKIGALLADMKLPWAYLTASRDGSPSMLKRISSTGNMPGVDKLEWANAEQLQALVAALVKLQSKRKQAK
jgi:phage gp16-like protein